VLPADSPLLPRRPLARFGLLVAGCAAFALVDLAHTALSFAAQGRPFSFSTALVSMCYILSWVGLAPAAAALTRRFPVQGRRWPLHLALHFVAAFVAEAVVMAALLPAALAVTGRDVPFGQAYIGAMLSAFFFFQLTWAAVVAGTSALDYAGRLRRRDVRESQLEAQLAAAKLDALRMQLNPHFLFNTLHAVSTLMARDVRTARTMLSDLSDLLRLALDRSSEPELPLAEELDFLDRYLRIERTRFRDRLRVDVEVGADARGALVPTLLLQPLVENALKYGIAPRAEGGHVQIEARRLQSDDGDRLLLRVTDDGAGFPDAAGRREGVGLRTTRERLATRFGDAARLRLFNRPEGGAVVEVTIPFRYHPAPPIAAPAARLPDLAPAL
jgi:two-component sensor histidine kinase